MAKRHLGLGKAAKAKKQKTEPDAEAQPQASNELTVELSEEIDANDELGQLKGLWNTYCNSEKDNELVVNGIIHECDRLLRNEKESSKLPDYFHSIYANSLAELANFHTTDNTKVKEFFDAALERVDLGLSHYEAGSIDLLFTKSRILIKRIPLQHISQLTLESKIAKEKPSLGQLLDEALQSYELAEKRADELKQYELFNQDNLEILEALDDVLDMVDNFGKEQLEGEDEDDEDEDDDAPELSESHPLYSIQNTDKYNQWWRDHILKFLENVDLASSNKAVQEDHALHPLRREICKRIGQSYLQESEIPSGVFTTLTYEDEYQDETELEGLTREQAQKIAQELIQTAIKYLEEAQDKEDPESWVHVAEALISLGNLYELDSDEQEASYKKAEAILNKANNVTNGQYEEVLENLLQS
ncbi:enhancer of translation termination 1 [Suhomyces tanzawaensis NRRL Y-17324]|uniref:Enhancer of translation termination 1 n=1 Tax=Suhomyces tanzawaensis NRRL Y-17324 TaxID=984487 RepID=A0A1E4SJR1_9ASCO|nr:enhancer of translation termination 1 [Suhomyces tanzawaensis NRRL Y-17324]ODV79739.1 enhancer of translation termination 1 [Suhomyces tanzawaensis NRRL Y-17324]